MHFGLERYPEALRLRPIFDFLSPSSSSQKASGPRPLRGHFAFLRTYTPFDGLCLRFGIDGRHDLEAFMLRWKKTQARQRVVMTLVGDVGESHDVHQVMDVIES